MPFGSEPNGGRPPSRMRFQRKMDPRISGGTIVDMFNKEFRTLLSLIISPAPASICLSKSRMRSMLISRPMLSDPTRVSRRGVFTYTEDNAFS